MLCQSLLWKTAAFRLRLLRLLAVAAAAAMLSSQAHADFIGFPPDLSGFTVNQNDSGNAATIANGTIHLTNQSNGEYRSVFCNTPQNISQFTIAVTYQNSNVYNYFNGDCGAAIVLQNSAAGARRP